MSAQIGISPIGWSNDDLPDLGGSISVETCLQEAREAGYAGIELGGKMPRQAAELQGLLTSFDLRLASGWYGAELRGRSAREEFEAMAPHTRLLQALGCKVMVFADVTGSVHSDVGAALSKRPTLASEEWKGWTDKLSDVAHRLANQGLKLAYHPHMGTLIQSSEDVERLLDATPDSVGLTFDTGHAFFAGSDLPAVSQAWAERVAHVHFKDVRADVCHEALHADRSFLDAVKRGVFTVPGDGCIDFRIVWEALTKRRYDDWVIVEAEQDPQVANPLAYAKRGHQALRGLLDGSPPLA